MDYTNFQNSQTYKLDFLNSITYCTYLNIKHKGKYTISCHFIPISPNLSAKFAANAPNRDANQNTASASQKGRHVELTVNAKIVKILNQFSIIRSRMCKRGASVPNPSV